MGLSFESKPKQGRVRFWGVLLLIILAVGFIWWQRDRLVTGLEGQLQGAFQKIPPILSTEQPATQPAGQVKLVYSAVVDADTPAFTADLYLAEAEHGDNSEWTGLAGRTAVETYTVQDGDTLWGIAAQFELDVDTLRWSNPALERNPDLLAPGTELVILPVIGAYHTVITGETITALAAKYAVAEVDITNYPLNKLVPPYKVAVGTRLVIPNGRKDVIVPTPQPNLDFPLAWPLVGQITQNYSPGHPALDIGAPYGADVYAAADGTVLHAEWARTGYGFTVIIDHGNNLQTLYSHLKGALAQKGEQVTRGQAIGAVGSTGNSTGPHVHFEVRAEGERVNPLDYLNQNSK